MSVATPVTPLVTHVVPRLTAADLDGFPEDGKRRELIGGVLYVAAAPSRFHQEVQIRLIVQIGSLVKANGSGKIFAAPADVRFSEYDLVQPDIIFIRRERLGMYRGNTVHGAPDVVMEIVSPSNRGYDMRTKARLYEANAVPEYWVFDPERRVITQLVFVDGRHVSVEPTNGIYRSTVIPGLEIDPIILFAPLDE